MVAEIKDITEAIDDANAPKDQDTEAIVAELKESIKKMESDREVKLKAAKKQLVEMINITADKYRTATGTAEAYRVLKFIYGDEGDMGCLLNDACHLAHEMAEIAQDMALEASSLSYDDMDKLCEKYYTKDFNFEDMVGSEDFVSCAYYLAEEMMCIDLCRNVGGSAEDMVGFMNRCDEEIKQVKDKLDELEK